MLRDAPFATWAVLCAMASFAIAFTIFAVVLVRVIRMPRREAGRLASLPLDPERPIAHHESRK
jgi:hypothetical protein